MGLKLRITGKGTVVDSVGDSSAAEGTGTDTLKCVICSPMLKGWTCDRSSVSIVARGLKTKAMHVHTRAEGHVSAIICVELSDNSFCRNNYLITRFPFGLGLGT